MRRAPQVLNFEEKSIMTGPRGQSTPRETEKKLNSNVDSNPKPASVPIAGQSEDEGILTEWEDKEESLEGPGFAFLNILGVWGDTVDRRIRWVGSALTLCPAPAFPRLDARRLPHHVPPGVGAGAHQWETHQNQGPLGPRARAGPQPAAAGVGVPPTHHRGHLQPVVCLRARDGPGHPSRTSKHCSVAPGSGEESPHLPGQGSQCEKLECVDGPGDVLTGTGPAWRGGFGGSPTAGDPGQTVS